jgi:hypothetical protein
VEEREEERVKAGCKLTAEGTKTKKVYETDKWSCINSDEQTII